MQMQNYLNQIRFDLHITGAINGALVEHPEVIGEGAMMVSTVCQTKEEILNLVRAKLDEFYTN